MRLGFRVQGFQTHYCLDQTSNKHGAHLITKVCTAWQVNYENRNSETILQTVALIFGTFPDSRVDISARAPPKNI